ncbi:MAG TPA: cyanophycin synthetase, partial [Acidimicrobiales bacterium]|nr:cyanophycin synthetase [Acidimicrobiales bacterium]
QNAAMATVTAMAMGASITAASSALARFGGVARRYEHRGERNDVLFVDDYAHLPTEVAAVLAAALREQRRLVVVFQPHRYSRTAAVGSQFADAFAGADLLVVTDVFAAGETPMPGVTGRVVADAVAQAHPELELHYVANRSELREAVSGLLRPGDLCLTLGAGDLTALPDELMADSEW